MYGKRMVFGKASEKQHYILKPFEDGAFVLSKAWLHDKVHAHETSTTVALYHQLL